MNAGLPVSLTGRTGLLIVIEHALIVMAVLAAAVIRLSFGDLESEVLGTTLLWRSVLVALVLQVSLHYCDLYDLRTLNERRDLFLRLVHALGAASLVLAFLYYWLPYLIIGRGVFALATPLTVGLVAGWRMVFEWLSRKVPAERLLIVGTGDAAVALAHEFHARRGELGVQLVGFIEADSARINDPSVDPLINVVGNVADIPEIVRQQYVDRVVLSLADARGKLSMDKLLEMKLNDGVRFDHLASVYEQYTGKIAVENLRPSWLIFSEGFSHSRFVSGIKRALDIAVSVLALLVASPIMLATAGLIRLTSPGPIIYHQRRVGKDGRIFTIHKFRSMRADAEASTGAVWSSHNDPRVTRFGRFLRRTRLDELPQLWNIMRGEMSVVGPRPERPEFVARLTAEIPFYGQRHVVRPGLTGWAQIRHRYGSTDEDALQKLQYDLYYIKHLSIGFDLFIVIETVKTVLMRRGS